MFDLPKKNKTRIIDTLSKESTVEQAIIFGSRARGDSKLNSDIDIALIGCNIPISLNTKLRDSAGLYQLDIIRVEDLDNASLLANIKRDGVVIYGKEESAGLVSQA
jgi:predicted nucleotidyltransferase